MSAVPIRTISVKLDRNVAPITGEAFASAPLTVLGTLPEGLTFEGATRVYAELHAERDGSGSPLATSEDADISSPGQTAELAFSSISMQQIAGRYYVSVFAQYPDDRIETLRGIELHLFDGGAAARKRVYWGVSAATELDGDSILALEFSDLGSSRARSFTIDGDDSYIYYAYPEEWGEASFAAFGLPTLGWVESLVDLIVGNTITSMRVYRTPATQAGSGIEITVS